MKRIWQQEELGHLVAGRVLSVDQMCSRVCEAMNDDILQALLCWQFEMVHRLLHIHSRCSLQVMGSGRVGSNHSSVLCWQNNARWGVSSALR